MSQHLNMAPVERWVLIFAMPLAQVPNMALAVVLGGLREELGLSYVELGVVVGSFGLARVITALPAGAFLQRLDPRPTLLAALVVSLLAMAMGYLATVGWQLVLSRVLFGAASSVVYGISLPWLLGNARGGSKGRVRVMAFMEAAFCVVALGAPLTTGALADMLNWRGAFILGALATAAAFLGIAFLTRSDSARLATGYLPPTSPTSPRPSAAAPTGWKSLRVGGSLLLIAYLATLAVFFSRQALFYTLLPVIATDRVGMSPLDIGGAFALLNVVGTVVLILGAWLTNRLNSRQFILLGMLLLVLPQLGLFFVADSTAFMIVTALHGLAFLVNPVPTSLVGDALPAALRTRGIALYRLLGDLAMLVAPLVVGLTLEAGGYGAAILAVVATNTLAFACVVALMARGRAPAGEPRTVRPTPETASTWPSP